MRSSISKCNFAAWSLHLLSLKFASPFFSLCLIRTRKMFHKAIETVNMYVQGVVIEWSYMIIIILLSAFGRANNFPASIILQHFQTSNTQHIASHVRIHLIILLTFLRILHSIIFRSPYSITEQYLMNQLMVYSFESGQSFWREVLRWIFNLQLLFLRLSVCTFSSFMIHWRDVLRKWLFGVFIL